MSKPEEVKYFAGVFAELHAEMHSREVTGLPSQRRQLEAKIGAAKALSDDRKKVALGALYQLPEHSMLCHGDFHPGNILMSSRGAIVVDWNDATQGNPDADVMRTMLLLQQGRPVEGRPVIERIQAIRKLFLGTYLRRYSQIRTISLDQIEAWRLPVAAARLSEGIPEETNRLLSIVEDSLWSTSS